MTRPRIAIIGAGISGLTVARCLKDIADVKVFEKSRGVGGRMSTRYADTFSFDHGAQFFTARDAAFKSFLHPLIQEGIVAPWKGRFIELMAGKDKVLPEWSEPHYVARPTMNGLCKHLAKTLPVEVNTEIAPLQKNSDGSWLVADKNRGHQETFDWVISTAPPLQTEVLLAEHIGSDAFANISMKGCYALMIGFKRPWDENWIAAEVKDSPINWIAVNSTKPGRNQEVTSFVAHTSNDWASDHLDEDINAVQKILVDAFEKATEIYSFEAAMISAHRWRYASVTKAAPAEPLINQNKRLASVGDWCDGSRVEDAWLSAMRFSDALKAILR